MNPSWVCAVQSKHVHSAGQPADESEPAVKKVTAHEAQLSEAMEQVKRVVPTQLEKGWFPI